MLSLVGGSMMYNNAGDLEEDAYRRGWNAAMDECCRRLDKLTERQHSALKEWIKDMKQGD